MKIYSSRSDNSELAKFKKFAGKDVWVLARVGFFNYYINILDVDGSIVHYYFLKPRAVEHPEDKFLNTELRRQLELITSTSKSDLYLAPEARSNYKNIKLYPDKGCFSTIELLERAGLEE